MQTKEKIKDRILRRAARLWGYNEQELETSFDPLVAMLLEACGAELEKLSNEQENSKSRIIERLLEIMMPESHAGIFPSSCIMHAIPIENNYALSLKHQFHTQQNIPNIYNPTTPFVKIINFGPTGTFKLTSSELKFLAYSNKLTSITRTFHKEIITESKTYLQPAELWMGIQIPQDAWSLENLLMYADIRNEYQKEAFYYYLNQAKVYFDGNVYKLKSGYNISNHDNIDEIVSRNYNKIYQIYTEINNFYEHKFFHLEDTIDLNKYEGKYNIPDELITCFGEERMKSMQDVIWLQIKFPETMITEMLDSAMFSLNCFPAINKKLNQTSQTVDPFINYLPLETDDLFLDIDEISDSLGNTYHLKDFSEGTLDSGSATLRNDGVVRFDERNASDVIQYLLELLKDESASFSVLGGDFLDDNLKQLNQLIATLEQQAKEQNFSKSNFPYVIIRPKNTIENKDKELLTVEYWSCNGSEGNNIKPETRLSVDKGSDFMPNTMYLVTSSVGGRDRLSIQDKILSYRSTLLSHNRVVTFADIESFCRSHFKQSIHSIEIKKGTKTNSATNKGFERTIDIYIERNLEDSFQISDSEWEYLCDNLMFKLEAVSSNIYPYRLIVK